MGKLILIASGKGGVGKSTLAASLGVALSRMDKTVCVVDGDIGLRSQDALLGLENSVVYDLLDVTRKACALSQALVTPYSLQNLRLLPAAQFARSKDVRPKPLAHILRQLKEENDFVLLDAPAGLERGLRSLLLPEVDETLLICTPDDMCLRDTARAAALLERRELPRPSLVVNRLMPELISAGEMMSAKAAADVVELALLGEIPEDATVYRALVNHRLLMDVRCEASEAIGRIARRLAGETVELPGYGGKRVGWLRRRLLGSMKAMKEVTRA